MMKTRKIKKMNYFFIVFFIIKLSSGNNIIGNRKGEGNVEEITCKDLGKAYSYDNTDIEYTKDENNIKIDWMRNLLNDSRYITCLVKVVMTLWTDDQKHEGIQVFTSKFPSVEDKALSLELDPCINKTINIKYYFKENMIKNKHISIPTNTKYDCTKENKNERNTREIGNKEKRGLESFNDDDDEDNDNDNDEDNDEDDDNDEDNDVDDDKDEDSDNGNENDNDKDDDDKSLLCEGDIRFGMSGGKLKITKMEFNMLEISWRHLITGNLKCIDQISLYKYPDTHNPIEQRKLNIWEDSKKRPFNVILNGDGICYKQKFFIIASNERGLGKNKKSNIAEFVPQVNNYYNHEHKIGMEIANNSIKIFWQKKLFNDQSYKRCLASVSVTLNSVRRTVKNAGSVGADTFEIFSFDSCQNSTLNISYEFKTSQNGLKEIRHKQVPIKRMVCTSKSRQIDCMTVDGSKCIFPFTFQNKTYNYCPRNAKSKGRDGNERWCSTQVDVQTGDHIDGNAGICRDSCPFPKGEDDGMSNMSIVGLSLLGALIFLLILSFFMVMCDLY